MESKTRVIFLYDFWYKIEHDKNNFSSLVKWVTFNVPLEKLLNRPKLPFLIFIKPKNEYTNPEKKWVIKTTFWPLLSNGTYNSITCLILVRNDLWWIFNLKNVFSFWRRIVWSEVQKVKKMLIKWCKNTRKFHFYRKVSEKKSWLF